MYFFTSGLYFSLFFHYSQHSTCASGPGGGGGEATIKCSKTSVLNAFPLLVGAYVGRECGACPEAAGPAAQRRRSAAPRDRALAQHAKLDLPTPPPLLPPKGFL